MTSYRAEYEKWLDSPALSENEWRELHDIRNNDDEIKSRFFAPLEFGTAGLRGIMGMGIRRMNVHVVRHATQAFANVILTENADAAARGVVVCYDCRINSSYFAKEAASVMAANGINVRIFESLRPTPELSFAIRYYKAEAGINITASHNPKEYNGYKVYWSDGAQLPPEHAASIAASMENIDIFSGVKSMDYDEAVSKGLIQTIGEETDEAFLEKVMGQSIDSAVVKRVADSFNVVYTPFHGAGYKLVPEALRRLGVKNLFTVPEQMSIDGNFPTVKSPNPENPEGFNIAIKLARSVDAKLIIGTDPDSDRVGVIVRDGDDYVPITGNQMGVLLLDYIINARREKGTLPENAAALKTIVTTDMAAKVAETNGVHIENTFTGFKFMAEKLAEYEKDCSYECLLAYEESYGYMVGDYVRDKDAVTASMLIAEMAAHYSEKGMSLADAMRALYEKYGFHKERTLSLVMPGLDGLEKMQRMMGKLRENPLPLIGDTDVLRQRDYKTGKLIVPNLGVVGNTEMSGSDVLYYELSDGSSFIVRPSGTEPKVKIYILVSGQSSDECTEKLKKYSEFAQTFSNL